MDNKIFIDKVRKYYNGVYKGFKDREEIVDHQIDIILENEELMEKHKEMFKIFGVEF